jgi:hypothetical protein
MRTPDWQRVPQTELYRKYCTDVQYRSRAGDAMTPTNEENVRAEMASLESTCDLCDGLVSVLTTKAGLPSAFAATESFPLTDRGHAIIRVLSRHLPETVDSAKESCT